jgi:hypothetical protein
MRFVHFSSLLAVGALASCAPCDQEGCDALRRRESSAKDQSRIAGAIAYKSDVVLNGCQECGLYDAEVRAWSRTTRVVDQQELAAVREMPPVAKTLSKQGRYALPLSPGDYLVCIQDGCFETSVVAGGTTTLNVRLIDGTSKAYVALPDAPDLLEVQGLESSL